MAFFELLLLKRKEPKYLVAKLISFYLNFIIVCKQFETLALQ